MKPGNAGGGKGPHFWCACEEGKDAVIGDEPDNTEKIRTLQSKLYRKAKEEPDFRFYLLYDKIYREDILAMPMRWREPTRARRAWMGRRFEADRGGRAGGVAGRHQEGPCARRRIGQQPVRRVMIPKPGGGERPLGIPTIRDRVVQTAAKLVLEPIFEADLDPAAYGYRPGRSGTDAIQAVHALLCRGYTDVVDADLSQYFDVATHCTPVHVGCSKRLGCGSSALI